MKRFIPSLLFIILGAFVIAPLAKRADNPEPSVQYLKARYYFLQGAKAEAEGKIPEAFEFYKKAWQTDPTYPEAGYAYGLMRFSLDHDTLASLEEKRKSLRLSRSLVDKYPGDYFPAMNYAYMAGMVDSVEEPIRVFERLVELCPDKTVSLLYLSQFYGIKHQSDKAIEALNRYERAEGSSVPLTLRKVVYRLSENDTVGALSEADKLIMKNPSEPAGLLLKGNVFESIGQPDSAFSYYNHAELVSPEAGSVKQQLAKFYAQRGDSVNFDLKTYQALLCEDLDLSDKLQMMATYLQKIISDKSDTQRGDTLFNILRTQYPHDPEILFLSARYNGAKKDFKNAIEDLRYAIDLDGDKEELWQTLILYQLSNEQPAEAMASYRNMKRLIPDPTLATDLLFANAAVAADSVAEAITLYQDILYDIDRSLSLQDSIADKSKYQHLSIEQTALISDLYEMAGDAFYADTPKHLEDAFRSYVNALFFNPDNLLALNNYAYFLIEHNNPEPESDLFRKAKEMSRKTVDRSGEINGTYYDTYAWILFKEGNYKEARQYQQAAIEAEEEKGSVSAELYSHYGDILFMLGEPDEAVSNWEKALKLEPEDELLLKKVRNRTFYWK